MPKKVERCVKNVKKTIKPRKKGQSKESAAWGVCSSAMKRKRKSKK